MRLLDWLFHPLIAVRLQCALDVNKQLAAEIKELKKQIQFLRSNYEGQ